MNAQNNAIETTKTAATSTWNKLKETETAQELFVTGEEAIALAGATVQVAAKTLRLGMSTAHAAANLAVIALDEANGFIQTDKEKLRKSVTDFLFSEDTEVQQEEPVEEASEE